MFAGLVVNQPMVFKIIWAIMSVFMKKKLQERIQVLGTNHARLKDFLPDGAILESHIT